MVLSFCFFMRGVFLVLRAVFAGLRVWSFSGLRRIGFEGCWVWTGGDGGNPSLPSRKKFVQLCLGWFFGFGLFWVGCFFVFVRLTYRI